MIKTLEKSARTEDEALRLGLDELGMDRDDVSVEILQRAKSGFLGIGAVNAKIRISYEVPDPKPEKKSEAPKVEKKAEAPKAEKPQEKKVEKKPEAPKQEKKPEPRKPEKKPETFKAEKKSEPKSAPVSRSATAPAAAPADENADCAAVRAFLNGLLDHMGVKADMEIKACEDSRIEVNLTGSGIGAVIGRRGETLDAVQHLTNYAVNKGSEKRLHISVDAENYRSKREESLIHLAEKMAEKAIKYKRSMALEPMNSYERHVIHTALQNYEGVTTASTGTEPNRRVVVSCVKGETPSNKHQTREWA